MGFVSFSSDKKFNKKNKKVILDFDIKTKEDFIDLINLLQYFKERELNDIIDLTLNIDFLDEFNDDILNLEEFLGDY